MRKGLLRQALFVMGVMMSASADVWRRKARKRREEMRMVLSRTHDLPAMQMLWAINVMQTDTPPDIRRYLTTYPKAAAKAQMGDAAFALKWELENLILLMLSTPKDPVQLPRPPDYYNYNTAALLLNMLKKADEAEEVFMLRTGNPRIAMQKLAHKQFVWQRAWLQTERLYRHYYVYGQGECAEYFESTYGLSMGEFAISSFALHLATGQFAWQQPMVMPKEIGMRPEAMQLTIQMMTKEHADMRRFTAEQISKMTAGHTSKLAFLPSTLRQFPIISSNELDGKLIAPLPQLIIYRATTGLYYDLATGPKSLVKDATNRFEEYGKKLIEAHYPRFKVLREQSFGTKANTYLTPDLLLKDGDTIRAVFECKATKLTFGAQYADDPFNHAREAFDQLSKGISQLWKFFSRARRGLYTQEEVAPDAHGIILTMDTWYQLQGAQMLELRAAAELLVAKEPDMRPEDMRHIIVCSIEELDDVIAVSDEDEFLDTFTKAKTPEFINHAIPTVRQPVFAAPLPRKDYPFGLSEVIPLWEKLQG